MKYFLSPAAVLKWLETPSVFNIRTDELYEVDETGFAFLRECASETGAEADGSDFLDYCLQEGIVDTKASASRRPLLAPSPVPSLRYLELQITDRCNLRCGHCYIEKTEHNELTPDEVSQVLSEFEDMQGLRLLISGGEPLVHRDFRSVNEMLPGYRFRKVLFTNGLLLRRDVLDSLNVDEIQVSIDGLEEAHDFLRGHGTFRAAMEAVQRGLDGGFEVSVATMVHPRNVRDFEGLESMFRRIGIREWTVDVPCAAGRLSGRPDIRMTPAEAAPGLRYGFGGGLHGGSSGFGCGIHLMAVLADGKTAKCTFYADRAVGTIRDGLRACWEKISPVRLSDLACDCDHIDLCRGGCRYRAELLGSPSGKDLYRCESYGIMGKRQEAG